MCQHIFPVTHEFHFSNTSGSKEKESGRAQDYILTWLFLYQQHFFSLKTAEKMATKSKPGTQVPLQTYGLQNYVFLKQECSKHSV